MGEFVHLHLHTQYSLLDGSITIPKLFERAQELGFQALAITDHGNMFGVVPFYKRAKAAGIHPILGCETYMAPGSRLDKTSHKGLSDASYHLILLVKDQEGYKNLVKLVSAAHLEGFYYKPRIDKEILREHSKGLIALSACLKGEIPHRILQGDLEGAREAAREYLEIMGEGNFYLEIQHNGIPEQEEVNRELISMAREMGIPLVATNDCHYLHPQDAQAHDVLLCIQTGKLVQDQDRMKMSTDQLYLRPPEEMKRLFSHLEEAVDNTWEIANRCQFEFQFGQLHLPVYEVPQGYDLDTYLEHLAREGLKKRKEKGELHPDKAWGEYQERLKEELAIIKDMGFSGYFLIVWDFVRYARERGIPVGPGRGSAAGSLVSYALGITNIDPLPYNLLFERFLNPERVSMPDIDIDFCMDRRDEVIEYVRDKYGKDNVAKIITFGTLSARAVVRDVGRALGVPYKDVDRIAKLIPSGPGINMTVAKAIEEVPQLKELMEEDARIKELLDISQKLEGLSRHASTHAAGVVITPEALTEYVPLYRGTDNEVVTQYAKDELEELGLLKMDLLGLKTLTVIQMALDLIERFRGEKLDLDHLPLDDAETYRLLEEGRTLGVFQLESSGMRELIKKLKPSRFEDLIALVALYRPGPLGSGMVDDFINRKHGKVKWKAPLPQIEDILAETYGVILYQEQVMQIASRLAGFSMGQADLLRRAMGKKKMDVMLKQKEAFIKGATERGVSRKDAEHIFDLMENFAKYGFNKSHSAAYALIAYQTAYLKAHYPVEFMAALISGDMGNTDKIYKYIQECKEMNIRVLPPDVNESIATFSVRGSSIRFGMAAIKNVGESAVEAILEAREKGGPFKSLYDFCCRVDTRKVNRKTIESLIKAGAMDSLGKDRNTLLEALDQAMEAGQRAAKRARLQRSLFELDEGHSLDQEEEVYPEVPPASPKELLTMEKEALGFYVTGHPMDLYQKELEKVVPGSISQVLEGASEGDEVILGGMVATFREIATKNGKRMAFAQLEDREGSTEVVIFPDLYSQVGMLLLLDEPLVVKGKVTTDAQGEEKKVTAQEVMLMKEALKNPPKASKPRNNRKKAWFLVEIHLEGLEEEAIDRLWEVAKNHPGEARLLLRFLSPGGEWVEIEADREFSVAPQEEVRKEMEALLNGGRVELRQ